jgi:hypothetical protein
MKIKLSAVRLLCAAAGLASTAAHAVSVDPKGGIVTESTFDTRYVLSTNNPANLVFVTDPANLSRKVMQLTAQDDGPSNVSRTDIAPKDEDFAYVDGALPTYHWYAFSVYFPADWTFDSAPVTVARIESSNPGLPAPFAVTARDHRLELTLTSNHRLDGGIDPMTADNSMSRHFPIGELTLGKWTCFVVKADWNPNLGKGYLQFWLNGKYQPAYSADLSYSAYAGTTMVPRVGLGWNGHSGVASRTLLADYMFVASDQSMYVEFMKQRTPCQPEAQPYTTPSKD